MLQRLWLRRAAGDRDGAEAAGGARIGIVCPYSFDVPGRRAEPRASTWPRR